MGENLSADTTAVVEDAEQGLVRRADADATADVVAQVNSLNSTDELGVYSSIDGSTFEGKLETLHALTNSTPASEHLNEAFSLKDIVVQAITLTNANQDGELEETPAVRVILVTDAGNFHAVSNGLFRSVKNLVSALGHPSTWPTSVKCRIVEERSRNGFRFMTLKIDY